ncbi:hypothetical protein OJF2_75110 [Aquisphaera giovannonii]|uniref:Uncharacterized protein n=1 Tax=Aquisphaera giovannonii TaxID=406548 RepID=A0A5B9WFY0_9BACT|nr:DUF433 domain-containing protein [Aquisphaera giovannonii]QEH38901.1 hypothetical protein OJF2_75110 [Aquisphaera giovannonii]
MEGRKAMTMGRPLLERTRLIVEHILSEMAAGMTDAEILDDNDDDTLRPRSIRTTILRTSTGRPEKRNRTS